MSRLEYAKQTVQRERKQVNLSRKRYVASNELQTIVQTTAQEIQQHVHGRISAIVTQCLVAVFDKPYEFAIRFRQRRGRTDATIELYKEGHRLSPRNVGGGVRDVVAFGARVASLIMWRRPLRKFLVLDEPFKFLQPVELYMPRVKALLNMLSDEFGIQFIMVTHISSLKVGQVVEID